MQTIINDIKLKMDDKLISLESQLNTIRTGAANANILDRISIDYYGSQTPLNQLSSITISEGKTLVIKPYDISTLKLIERAINESDLNIPPQSDGSLVRLTMPSLTEETRRQLTKTASKYGEDTKIVIRNIRRDANEHIKRDKTISEDNQKDILDNIQKITDDYIKQIDIIVKNKEQDIMKI